MCFQICGQEIKSDDKQENRLKHSSEEIRIK